jgi:hypothetical protein
VVFNWFRIAPRRIVSPTFEVVDESPPPRRQVHPVDSFVVGGWILILTKCILASIAIHHWNIPIADFYVWGPSVIFGATCTFLYLTRE